MIVLEQTEKEVLLKASKNGVKYILTHRGFTNNCKLSDDEIELLHSLAYYINKKDLSIVIEDNVYTAYFSSCYNDIVLAGIKINKLVLES